MAACLLFIIIPPSLAYGFTRNRYLDGTAYGSGIAWEGWTSGFLDRQYNAVYRSPDYCHAWRVRYYRNEGGGLGTITWQHDSQCSPTSIGQTTGPRRAYCRELEFTTGLADYVFNCDTTVP